MTTQLSSVLVRHAFRCALLCALTATGCKDLLGLADDPPAATPRDMERSAADMTVATEADLASSGLTAGSACSRDQDCAGFGKNAANCDPGLTEGDGSAIEFPGGYCTSDCNPSKVDGNEGTSPDCAQPPAGNSTTNPATCLDFGDGSGLCVAMCAEKASCRSGYHCAWVNDITAGCLPDTLSECAKGGKSCGTGRICTSDGPDDSGGYCEPTCDAYRNTGCPTGYDCHIYIDTWSPIHWAPVCWEKNGMPASVGATCQYIDDCGSGYGCYVPSGQTMGKCYKYCNTANAATQCSAGAKCDPYLDDSDKPQADGTGVCTGSS